LSRVHGEGGKDASHAVDAADIEEVHGEPLEPNCIDKDEGEVVIDDVDTEPLEPNCAIEDESGVVIAEG
jgi:hypothetical protein